MPQRGDNPNEILYIAGSAWAHHNVDNFYDVDSSLQRPVDEILASLEEEFECPLVHLEFRRRTPRAPHFMFKSFTAPPVTQPRSYDALILENTEIERILEFIIHERN